jgi:hypothetical protein
MIYLSLIVVSRLYAAASRRRFYSGRHDVVFLISSYIDIWPFTDLCAHVGHER